VEDIKTLFGGRNYKGTCAIFTSGTYDPWSAFGFTSQSETSSSNTVFLIESTLISITAKSIEII